MFSVDDLHNINEQLLPLKSLADRELRSIYGLSGMLYTPHIDAYNDVCMQKAKILLTLKKNKLIPFTQVEIITEKLKVVHFRAKNHQIIEFEGSTYECLFSPLKLSKSGKSVSKWAKYWVKKLPNGEKDVDWERQLKEIWPENFIIKSANF